MEKMRRFCQMTSPMTDLRSACSVARSSEDAAQPGPGGDAGFRENPVQVIADRSVRQI